MVIGEDRHAGGAKVSRDKQRGTRTESSRESNGYHREGQGPRLASWRKRQSNLRTHSKTFQQVGGSTPPSTSRTIPNSSTINNGGGNREVYVSSPRSTSKTMGAAESRHEMFERRHQSGLDEIRERSSTLPEEDWCAPSSASVGQFSLGGMDYELPLQQEAIDLSDRQRPTTNDVGGGPTDRFIRLRSQSWNMDQSVSDVSHSSRRSNQLDYGQSYVQRKLSKRSEMGSGKRHRRTPLKMSERLKFGSLSRSSSILDRSSSSGSDDYLPKRGTQLTSIDEQHDGLNSVLSTESLSLILGESPTQEKPMSRRKHKRRNEIEGHHKAFSPVDPGISSRDEPKSKYPLGGDVENRQPIDEFDKVEKVSNPDNAQESKTIEKRPSEMPDEKEQATDPVNVLSCADERAKIAAERMSLASRQLQRRCKEEFFHGEQSETSESTTKPSTRSAEMMPQKTNERLTGTGMTILNSIAKGIDNFLDPDFASPNSESPSTQHARSDGALVETENESWGCPTGDTFGGSDCQQGDKPTARAPISESSEEFESNYGNTGTQKPASQRQRQVQEMLGTSPRASRSHPSSVRNTEADGGGRLGAPSPAVFLDEDDSTEGDTLILLSEHSVQSRSRSERSNETSQPQSTTTRETADYASKGVPSRFMSPSILTQSMHREQAQNLEEAKALRDIEKGTGQCSPGLFGRAHFRSERINLPPEGLVSSYRSGKAKRTSETPPTAEAIGLTGQTAQMVKRAYEDASNEARHPVGQQCVVYNSFGSDPLNQLRVVSSVPQPRNAESSTVMIKVEASTVSQTDCLIRDGSQMTIDLDASLPITPGVDMCGVIYQIDSELTRRFNLQLGDRVVSLLRWGGNSRYLSVDPASLVRVSSKRIDPAECTCLVETYLSAFQLLHVDQSSGSRYRYNSLGGKTILVLGDAPTNLRRAIARISYICGCRNIFATAKDKYFEEVKGMGITPLSTDSRMWKNNLAGSVDLLIHLDGAMSFSSLASKVLRRNGHIVVATSYEEAGTPLASQHMCSRSKAQLRGRLTQYNTFRAWDKNTEQSREDLRLLLALHAKGLIVPNVIDRVPLGLVGEAQERVESRRKPGYIVCEPWQEDTKL